MTLKSLAARMRAALSCKRTTKLRKRRSHNSEKQHANSSSSTSTIEEEAQALLDERNGKEDDGKSACSCSDCLLKPCAYKYHENPAIDLYKSQELEAIRDPCFSSKIPLSTLTTEEWTERCELLKEKIRELETKLMMEKWLVVKKDRWATYLSRPRYQLDERYRVLENARGWFGKREFEGEGEGVDGRQA